MESETACFLGEVWPREKKAKSPRISIALLDLVFSDTVNPSEIADIVLPLISQAQSWSILDCIVSETLRIISLTDFRKKC